LTVLKASPSHGFPSIRTARTCGPRHTTAHFLYKGVGAFENLYVNMCRGGYMRRGVRGALQGAPTIRIRKGLADRKSWVDVAEREHSSDRLRKHQAST